MSREEFMERLAFLLSDISEEEREDALLYYEDYFIEAGKEKEPEIIRELGSPERVAAIIRNSSHIEDGGSFTERGFEDERFKDPNYQIVKRLDLPDVLESDEAAGKNSKNTSKNDSSKRSERDTHSEYSEYSEYSEGDDFFGYGREEDRKNESYTYGKETRSDREKKKPWTSRPLKIILGIILFSMIFDLLKGVLAVGRGAVGILAAVVLFAGMGVISMFILTIVFWGIAAVNIWNPAYALFFGGLGLGSLGVMLLFLVLSIQMYGKWIPRLFRRCNRLCVKVWNSIRRSA